MKSMKALFFFMLIFFFCAGAVQAAGTVKIGMLAPLTGEMASDGLSAHNSVKLALERVNKEGGILGQSVELVIYDDRADAKEAVALARKLIEQDKIVAFVAASYSMPSRAVAPIFQEEGIPLVAAYAVHPDVTKAGNFCFRNGFLGTVEGQAAAYASVEFMKAKRIALLASDNDFGRTLAAGFKNYIENQAKGVVLVYNQTYPMSEKDYKAYLSKIKEANPDLLFASGYYFQSGPIAKQAREMGLTVPIMGEEGADSPMLMQIAGQAAEGFTIVTNLNRDDPRPEVQAFLKAYRERYKIQPDMVGASAYDAFMIICDAIKRAKSTKGVDIQKAIAGIKDYSGLTGMIKGFTSTGEVIKDVQVQVVKNGEFHYLGVVKDLKVITPQ